LKPVRFFGVLTFIVAIALAIVFWLTFELDFLLSWLIAITIVAFLVCGYDKSIAGSGRMRVPEKVLLALTFAGGTMGTILGRSLFRHKTVKGSFRVKLWMVVGLQVILILVYKFWVESKF
jgi:uncharacterized membrane protein YsdA (DUF1294 family)